jgi:predicted lipid-binding transport protein (Tim44 family)
MKRLKQISGCAALIVSAVSLQALNVQAQDLKQEAPAARIQEQVRRIGAETPDARRNLSKRHLTRVASAEPVIATVTATPTVAEVLDAKPAAPEMPGWQASVGKVLEPLGISALFVRNGLTGPAADILGALMLTVGLGLSLLLSFNAAQTLWYNIADKVRRAKELREENDRLRSKNRSSTWRRSSSGKGGSKTSGRASHRASQNSLQKTSAKGASEQPNRGVRLEPTIAQPAGATPNATPIALAKGKAAPCLPPDFDEPRFLRKARVYFLRLQAAWDRSDLDGIRQFSAPPVFNEFKKQILARGESANHTDVLSIQTELISIHKADNHVVASVKFTGMIKESVSKAEKPFEEVWNLSRPTAKQGDWVLAGIVQY